jgi:hypothetical protein
MKQEIVTHDGNNQQSFTALPLKPKGQLKNMGTQDQISSDPAISSMKSLVEYAGGAFRNTTLHLDRWDGHLADLHLGATWNPRTASIIKVEQAAPRRRSPADPLQRKKRQVKSVIMCSGRPTDLCNEQDAQDDATSPRTSGRPAVAPMADPGVILDLKPPRHPGSPPQPPCTEGRRCRPQPSPAIPHHEEAPAPSASGLLPP